MEKYLDTLLQYHNWANGRIFELLDSIPPDEYSIAMDDVAELLRQTCNDLPINLFELRK